MIENTTLFWAISDAELQKVTLRDSNAIYLAQSLMKDRYFERSLSGGALYILRGYADEKGSCPYHKQGELDFQDIFTSEHWTKMTTICKQTPILAWVVTSKKCKHNRYKVFDYEIAPSLYRDIIKQRLIEANIQNDKRLEF
jgi:hypothetical protein